VTRFFRQYGVLRRSDLQELVLASLDSFSPKNLHTELIRYVQFSIGGCDIKKICRRYPISDIRYRQSIVQYHIKICRIKGILIRYRINPIPTELNPISVSPISITKNLQFHIFAKIFAKFYFRFLQIYFCKKKNLS
jgi:hypothetical protein